MSLLPVTSSNTRLGGSSGNPHHYESFPKSVSGGLQPLPTYIEEPDVDGNGSSSITISPFNNNCSNYYLDGSLLRLEGAVRCCRACSLQVQENLERENASILAILTSDDARAVNGFAGGARPDPARSAPGEGAVGSALQDR